VTKCCERDALSGGCTVARRDPCPDVWPGHRRPSVTSQWRLAGSLASISGVSEQDEEEDMVKGKVVALPTGTRTIPLTQGKVAVVDAVDYAELARYKWCASSPGWGVWYAVRGEGMPNGKRRTVYMHREVLGAAPGEQVDHVNLDGLDNRRENLRSATGVENSRNRRKRSGTSSQYKGVSWHKATRRWLAQIRFGARKTHLGSFRCEEDAARAYDAAAVEHFGEFARPNFPVEVKQVAA